jgi:methyl-accepting chemotaxis protein
MWSMERLRHARIDHLVMGLLGANVVLAAVIGQFYGVWTTALVWGALSLLPAGAARLLSTRPFTRRMGLAVSLVMLVALQIHLSGGSLEFHFNVFVTLSALLAYRDWRLIVFTGALFAVHHLVFDRLLAAGIGLYCLSEPSLGRILIHAGFVAAQCAFLTLLATLMRQELRAAREVESMVNSLGVAGPIQLQPSDWTEHTPTAKALARALARMRETLVQTHHTLDCVAGASNQVTDNSAALQERTTAIARDLGDAAMSLEQIVVIVRSNNAAAAEAKTMANEAGELADQGGQLVDQVVSKMDDIAQSSSRITDIVSVIDGLAFQTNILALNAAVEAARAGEHGKGFAVVASEVRNLALRSATAAREIKELIDASRATVSDGTALVHRTGDTIQTLVASVRRVGTLFQELSSDASDHADGLHVVTEAIGGLTRDTQGNTAVAEQSAQAAVTLHREVARLVETLKAFDVGALDPQSSQPAAGGAPAAGSTVDVVAGPGHPPHAISPAQLAGRLGPLAPTASVEFF